MMTLDWKTYYLDGVPYDEATLGDFFHHKGFRFSIIDMPTNNIRGRYRLLIEPGGRESSDRFDNDDQPMRYYHDRECLLSEAEAIATALIKGNEP